MEVLLSEEKEEENIMDICKKQDNIRHIVIPAIDLSKVDVGVRCTEPGCNEVFASSSNLSMHLAKKHKTSAALNKKEGTTVFHCPENGCKYGFMKSSFPRTTLLKQHYLKVHAAKDHICNKCSQGFSTLAARSYHARSCGRGFVCSCGAVYKTNEALLTHARRKQHKVIKPNASALVCKTKVTQPRPEAAVPVHLLAAVALSELSRPITREIAIQTDESELKSKRKESAAKATGTSPMKPRRRASTHTQTLAPKTSAETQTSGDLLLRRAMLQADIRPTKLEHMETQTMKPSTSIKNNKRTNCETQTLKSNIKKRKHTETQTIKLNKKSNKDIIKKTVETQSENINKINNNILIDIDKTCELQNELKSANLTEIDTEITLKEFTPSKIIINDVSLPEIWLNQKSTQTSPSEQINISSCSFSPFRNEDDTLENLLRDDDKFQTIETQTELAGFTAKFLEDCDSNFTLCSHIETQTCDELNKSFEDMGSQIESESFEEMLHSNMYTQTCDNLLLDFVDIQTQTWSDNSPTGSE